MQNNDEKLNANESNSESTEQESVSCANEEQVTEDKASEECNCGEETERGCNNDDDDEQMLQPDAELSEGCAQKDGEVDITDVVVLDNGDQAQPAPKSGKWNKVVDIGLWIIIALLVVALCLRLFVFGRIDISGESMTNDYYNNEQTTKLTFHDKQTVWINKTLKPKRGDVAVFFEQHVSQFTALFGGANDKKLIKRIVAFGGDKLWVEPTEKSLYRLCILTADGTVLHEDYYQKEGTVLEEIAFYMHADTGGDVRTGLGCLRNTTEENPYVVPQDCFFAMGDNRSNSADSRGDLGAVPLDQLYGIVI